jgi:hypothetical protein
MPSENAQPHHRKQIFEDHAQEDAALKQWEDDDGWIGWFIKNIAGVMRRMGLSS